MRLPKSIKENLFFLLAETASRIADLRVATETASAAAAQGIMDRGGYGHNLKTRVRDGCLAAMRDNKKGEWDPHSLRAAEIIASGLERIGDICRECASLMGKMSHGDGLRKQSGSRLLDDIQKGIALIGKAVESNDGREALRIGHIERKLDHAYEKAFRDLVRDIAKKKYPEDAVASLFIVHRIEEMGDVLLDISEALVSAKLGRSIQIDRYRLLEKALNDLGIDDAEVAPMAETKSGGGISGISSKKEGDEGYVAIFKDGGKDKLAEERERVEDWHEIFPGLAPRILGYRKKGKKASLLIEHLEGFTFEQLLFQDSDELLARGLKRLNTTMKAVWNETKRGNMVEVNHMSQLRERLPSVSRVHGDFNFGPAVVCGKAIKSLDRLIDGAAELEARLKPPFSVFIHGDFNLDNIIYDPEANRSVYRPASIRLYGLRPGCRRFHGVELSFASAGCPYARKNCRNGRRFSRGDAGPCPEKQGREFRSSPGPWAGAILYNIHPIHPRCRIGGGHVFARRLYFGTPRCVERRDGENLFTRYRGVFDERSRVAVIGVPANGPRSWRTRWKPNPAFDWLADVSADLSAGALWGAAWIYERRHRRQRSPVYAPTRWIESSF